MRRRERASRRASRRAPRRASRRAGRPAARRGARPGPERGRPGALARRVALGLTVALWLGGPAAAQPRGDYARRFDAAWSLVDTRYWNIERTGVDWAAIGNEYRPIALAAADDDAFYEVLERMYDELGDQHSVFVPPAKVAQVRAEYGDLPCVMVLGLGALPLAPLPAAALASAAGLASAATLAYGGVLRSQVPSARPGSEDTVANVTFGLTAEGVGYVRLPDLATGGAAEGVRTAVSRLEGEGAWSLVLDLRGNPGGRLVTMMQVAGVFTSGLLWRTITSWALPLPYPAIGVPQTALPLAVLIDGGVNSAAEGLAGALQARGRAVVVGERSAGNVEALLPFCLRDGSQAWVAAGVLAPIGAPTWEGRGVQPDVEASSADALEAAIDYLSREERP